MLTLAIMLGSLGCALVIWWLFDSHRYRRPTGQADHYQTHSLIFGQPTGTSSDAGMSCDGGGGGCDGGG